MGLFKYIHPCRTSILSSNSLRFTQPKYLNDPFEQLPFFSSFVTPEIFDKLLERLTDWLSSVTGLTTVGDVELESVMEFLAQGRIEIEKDRLLSGLNQGVSHLVSEGKNYLHDPETVAEIKKAVCSPTGAATLSLQLKNFISDRLGILCLTQRNDNIPMWTHYAKDSSGFVIEFDTSNSFFHNDKYSVPKFTTLQGVLYPEKRPDIIFFDRDTGLLEHLGEAIFLTKSFQWFYEEEVRLIRFLDEANNRFPNPHNGSEEICLFSFDPSAIISIYLGINVKPKCEAEIVAILDQEHYAHVKLYKAVLNPREYTLDFEPYYPV